MSLLSYRSDVGSPGYTGYIASPQRVVLPQRCGDRLGRHVDAPTQQKATTDVVERARGQSQYTGTFAKAPQDTQPCLKAGGGYWIPQRDAMKPVPPKFVATTTYKAEMLNGEATAASQLERSEGLRCTLSPYEAARSAAHKGQPTSGSLRSTLDATMTRTATMRPSTAITSAGELVGYQTTNGDRLSYTQEPLDFHKKRPESVPGDPRYRVMPRAMAPGMFGVSTGYSQDYGPDNADPMERAAPCEKFQTRMATTRDLAQGTTRNNNNLPGYTGHIAASPYNALARAQSDAPDERSNFKNDMTLFHLDQFTHGRVPHYTGFQPKAARNATLEQPSQGPTKATTSGAAAAEGTKFAKDFPPIDHKHYINSRAGLMTFFTSGGMSQSDNGLFNAQTYFKCAPPVDGRFKMSRLPHVTHYGKSFNDGNSLV